MVAGGLRAYPADIPEHGSDESRTPEGCRSAWREVLAPLRGAGRFNDYSGGIGRVRPQPPATFYDPSGVDKFTYAGRVVRGLLFASLTQPNLSTN